MELRPRNHIWYGFGALVPYWQSEWTLWATKNYALAYSLDKHPAQVRFRASNMGLRVWYILRPYIYYRIMAVGAYVCTIITIMLITWIFCVLVAQRQQPQLPLCTGSTGAEQGVVGDVVRPLPVAMDSVGLTLTKTRYGKRLKLGIIINKSPQEHQQ